jgi:mannose-1-phosphate guanylyltransferase / mannose-6-phosphate isomerase
MNTKSVAVILSGGSGTRLWPVSRAAEPKQFQVFTGEHSLLTQTVIRADGIADIDEILIVCSAEHQNLVRFHTKAFTNKPISFLLEPIARNTAAAIACAAHYLKQQNPKYEISMLVLPSDHHMASTDAFRNAIRAALKAAVSGYLVTFGIRATKPETGFGYLELGQAVDGLPLVNRVLNFVEKPTLEKAQSMIDTSRFSWNSGMFVLAAENFLSELAHYEPEIHSACESSLAQANHKKPFTLLGLEALMPCPNISVDYAVFERSDKVAMVALDVPWTDLGSWEAVANLRNTQATEQSQKTANDAIVFSVHSEQNFVQSNKTVAMVGVKDLIVIDTPDALLISHREKTQSVKDIVTRIQTQKPELAVNFPKVRRPWGSYESLHHGMQHQVKHILVEPGQRLSLQSHEHRSEHWVVIHGQATITVGESRSTYLPGQHVYIDKLQKHRLENMTQERVEIIEVQIGSYLGEDDIQRFDDVYGRA